MPVNTLHRLPAVRLLTFVTVFLVLTGAGLYGVYHYFANAPLKLVPELFAPQVLAAIAGLLVVYFAADGLRLYCTLRALGYRVPALAMSKLVFINLFFSNITPMATGGGFAQVWYLNQQGVPVGPAMAATTIRTLLAVVMIFSMTPLLLLALPPLSGSATSVKIGWTLAVLVTLYLSFFVVAVWRPRWLVAPLLNFINGVYFLRWIGAKRAGRWRYRLKQEVRRFSDSFSDYCRGPKWAITASIVFTAVFLLSLFSFPALLLAALDYEVPYLHTLGLLVVTTFIMYFAPTPGAAGVSEGVFGRFFAPLIGPEHLLLVILAWRFLTIYLGMIIGMVLAQRSVLRKARASV